MRLTTPFTRVPDVVLDELLPRLSLIELRTLFAILRYTLGFDRLRTQPMRLEVLGKKTGLSPRSVRRGLSSLESQGLLIRRESPGWASRYELTLPSVDLLQEEPRERASSSGQRGPPSPDRAVRSHEIETIDDREESYFSHEEDSPESVLPDPLLQPPCSILDPSTEASSIKILKSTERTLESPLPIETGELASIADTAATLLQGKTLSLIRSEEILQSLRSLKADILNRGLDVDLKSLVLDRVESGIEANFRKNGGRTSIWTWGYFVPRLRDAVDEKALIAEREVQKRAQQDALAEEEAERERQRAKQQEEETAKLRARWELLDTGQRQNIESAVMRELPEFILQCIQRDRRSGNRGTGLIALEQGCFRELARVQ